MLAGSVSLVFITDITTDFVYQLLLREENIHFGGQIHIYN